jgi:hypothetical protein
MNDEELTALEELEAEMGAIRDFLKEEEPVAAELAPEPTPEPESELKPAPEPVKAKKAPKAKKEVKKETPKPVAAPEKQEVPVRLYGAARLRARLGR